MWPDCRPTSLIKSSYLSSSKCTAPAANGLVACSRSVDTTVTEPPPTTLYSHTTAGLLRSLPGEVVDMHSVGMFRRSTAATYTFSTKQHLPASPMAMTHSLVATKTKTTWIPSSLLHPPGLAPSTRTLYIQRSRCSPLISASAGQSPGAQYDQRLMAKLHSQKFAPTPLRAMRSCPEILCSTHAEQTAGTGASDQKILSSNDDALSQRVMGANELSAAAAPIEVCEEVISHIEVARRAVSAAADLMNAHIKIGVISPLRLTKTLVLYDLAAVKIQSMWRGIVAKRLARELKQKELERIGATKIQSAWRGYLGRWNAALRRHIRLHALTRIAAACRVQRAWRNWQARIDAKVERLARVMSALRNLSAMTIQRVWRGWQVRRIIEDEWKHWVVKWVWDPAGRDVSVIGTFTSPPWQIHTPMNYCPIRRCYVANLPRRPGRYEIKFCVDGRLVCCGAGTVVEDGNGHFNNVVDVFAVPPTSPFEKCRNILRQVSDSRHTTASQSVIGGSPSWITSPALPQTDEKHPFIGGSPSSMNELPARDGSQTTGLPAGLNRVSPINSDGDVSTTHGPRTRDAGPDEKEEMLDLLDYDDENTGERRGEPPPPMPPPPPPTTTVYHPGHHNHPHRHDTSSSSGYRQHGCGSPVVDGSERPRSALSPLRNNLEEDGGGGITYYGRGLQLPIGRRKGGGDFEHRSSPTHHSPHHSAARLLSSTSGGR